MGRTKGYCKTLSLIWIIIPTITVFARSFNYAAVINPIVPFPAESEVSSEIISDNNLYSDNSNDNNLFNEFHEYNHHHQRYKRSSSTSTGNKHPGPTLRKSKLERTVAIFGIRMEYESDKKRVEYSHDGTIHVLEGLPVTLRLYGKFKPDTNLMYTKNVNCEDERNAIVKKLTLHGLGTNDTYLAATVDLKIPSRDKFPDMYFCLQYNNTNNTNTNGSQQPAMHWESQGSDIHIKTEPGLLPLWLHILLIIFLLILSGLFSGLNLGLMSLNKTDLKIIINTGNPVERAYAKKIAPVRNHGNFLLCCLLFSNVLVNASLTILVDELTSGVIAVIMSTMAIVIFGEIIPQAICSRHGLAVGARTIYVTKFFMAITFPLAYPLSKILDKLLGEEIGNVYTRERLKELLKVTRDYHGLETEEVGIISGALDMKTKTVKDIMTDLDEVFMLPIDTNLNYETIGDIEYHGFSRIPVYEKERSNVVSVLNVKQLTLLDAGDNIPIRTVVEYYQNSLFYVFENTRLDYMFKAFREGNRGHMAFVQKVNDEGPGDPYYETIGVVTMEDVLEELLQQEIMDESDIGKTARKTAKERTNPKDPFKTYKKNKNTVDLPPPLLLAASQFLTTSVPPFSREYLTESVMRRLIKIFVRETKPPKSRPHDASSTTLYLYEMGRPADYFILILEGRVEVSVGRENLNFEAGPFHQFGSDFLLMESSKENKNDLLTGALDESIKTKTFIPDYTVKVISDVIYIRLKYSNYRNCRIASELDKRHNKDSDKEPDLTDNWQETFEKYFVDDEDGETEIRKVEANQHNHMNSLHVDTSIMSASAPASPVTTNRKSPNDKGTKEESSKLL